MQFPAHVEETHSFNELIKEISRTENRTIHLHEIALAILTGSCEKYCNPSFEGSGAVFNPNDFNLHPQHVMAASKTRKESCGEKQSEDECPNVVIPDSFELSLEQDNPNTSNNEETSIEQKVEIISAKRKNLFEPLGDMTKKPKVDTNMTYIRYVIQK